LQTSYTNGENTDVKTRNMAIWDATQIYLTVEDIALIYHCADISKVASFPRTNSGAHHTDVAFLLELSECLWHSHGATCVTYSLRSEWEI